MRRRRQREAGLTMVEILVSVVLVGIACAFVFSIQVRMSSALRDQSTVSEVQQTLRSASDLLSRDIRMSGYLAQQFGRSGLLQASGPVTVQNGGVLPDTITIAYADTTAVALVNAFNMVPTNGSFSFLLLPWETYVNDPTGLRPTPVTGFAVGDIVLATHAKPTYDTLGNLIMPGGVGCVLAITNVIPPDRLVTSPLGNPLWNLLGGLQCTGLLSPLLGTLLNMSTVWNDGSTEFTHLVYRTYRIKDLATDPRGVLQLCEWTQSASQCVAPGDWTDLALGIVDMQIALRVVLPANPAPCAIDADATHDWYSSDNMDAIPAGAKVIEVSITLLAKSTKEVQGVTLDKTPDLFEGNKLCNHVGDVDGTPLPVASTASPYYGDRIYRTYTSTVELRNAAATN